MIPLEILNYQQLFSLLYKIDLDLAEQTRAQHCPIAGVHCIVPTTRASLGVGPLICQRLLNCDSACAVLAPVAGAGFYHHRCASGGAGSTGHP